MSNLIKIYDLCNGVKIIGPDVNKEGEAFINSETAKDLN